MNDSRRVVSRVGALADRPVDDRWPQIPARVRPPNPLVDGLTERTAGEVCVLADLSEEDDRSGVLTHRNAARLGDIRVLQEQADRLLSDRRQLALARSSERFDDIRRQLIVRVEAEPLDSVAD